MSSAADKLEELCQLTAQSMASLEIADHFRVVKQLGQGSYGKVMLAVHRQRGTPMALKLFPRSSTPLPVFLREYCLSLSLCSHPCLAGALGIVFTTPRLYVFAQQAALFGDLYDIIVPEVGVREECAQRVLSQLAQALAYLHALGFVHRDVKPENVFLCDGPECRLVKLGDFGLARPWGSKFMKTAHPSPYCAPELSSGLSAQARAEEGAAGGRGRGPPRCRRRGEGAETEEGRGRDRPMERGRGGDRGRGGARGKEGAGEGQREGRGHPRSSLPEKDTEEAEAETGPSAARPAENARGEEEGRRKKRAKKEWATAEPTIDSWALGVLVYCLLTGCFPWEQTCASDPLYRRYRRWFEAKEAGGGERASPSGRFYNPSRAEKRADSSTPIGGLPAKEGEEEWGRRQGDPEIEIAGETPPPSPPALGSQLRRGAAGVPPQFVGFTPLALALFRELLNPDPRCRGLPGEAERFLGEPWLRGRGAQEQGTRGSGEKEAGGQEGEVMGFSTGLRTGSKWSQQ